MSAHPDRPVSPDLPERPVDPDWLALREPADARARDGAVEAIIQPLLGRLRDRATANGGDPNRTTGLHVVDLGAGTGANLRWLAPRLAVLGGPAGVGAQQWTLVDHDPRLRAWGPARSTTVHADVADLPRLLSEPGRPDLVTAAALLDLLDRRQLDAVVGAVVAHRAPALFSLSVTGAVALDPADALDPALAAAFDAHQRRGRRLGPDAGGAAAGRFRRQGWAVVVAQTPWRLGSQPAALIDAWLAGRVDAAIESRPELATQAAEWLERRREQQLAGALSAVVGHLDVLALPPPVPTG
jgi:hypothetical protein